MGASNPRVERITNFVHHEEVKGETPPFRSYELAAGEPLHEKLPGGIDTVLKAFE